MVTSSLNISILGKSPPQHVNTNLNPLQSIVIDYPIQLRAPKIDFLVFFSQYDLNDWLSKSLHYFELDLTFDEWNVKVTATYLNGKALEWYYSFVHNLDENYIVTWDELV